MVKIKPSAATPGTLWIGTSNIAIPGAKNTFPEEYRNKTRLTYHAVLFNSLEVNSTFYNIPMNKTVARWATEVPDDFRFTLKVHKSITHQKQLQYNDHDISKFVGVANSVGTKKGCLLVQFPASITSAYLSRVEHMLDMLNTSDPYKQWRKAIEFRHPTWYNGVTEKMLDRHGVTLVLHDMPESHIFKPTEKATFIYCRFHGPAGDYKGGYDLPVLQEYAAQMKRWLSDGLDVYAYFNNTLGDAFENARTLRSLVYLDH